MYSADARSDTPTMRFLPTQAAECKEAFDVLHAHVDYRAGTMIANSPGQPEVQDALGALFVFGYTPDVVGQLLVSGSPGMNKDIVVGQLVLALQLSAIDITAEILKALRS